MPWNAGHSGLKASINISTAVTAAPGNHSDNIMLEFLPTPCVQRHWYSHIREKVSSPFKLVGIRTQGWLSSGKGQWSVCLFEREKKITYNTMCDSHCHTQQRTAMRDTGGGVGRGRKHRLRTIKNDHGSSDQQFFNWCCTCVISIIWTSDSLQKTWYSPSGRAGLGYMEIKTDYWMLKFGETWSHGYLWFGPAKKEMWDFNGSLLSSQKKIIWPLWTVPDTQIVDHG